MAKRTRAKATPEDTYAEPPPRAVVGVPVRPLDQIIGQRRAIGLVLKALATGRLHHAWIFHGPPGVGKFAAAASLGAMLLDPGAGPDQTGGWTADPDSHTARLIRAGTHPDFHVITKELAAVSRKDTVRTAKQTTIPLEVLREFLVEPASRSRAVASSSAASKVFIVDEAELLEPRTQNALLKALEEPPPGSVFILVTSHEDRLLPTIRSRCQHVAFSPLGDEEMAAWIDRQHPDLDPADRRWTIEFSCGSPGAAELSIAGGLRAWHERIGPMLDEADRGRYAPELAREMAQLIEERAVEAVKQDKDASKEAANRYWARVMLGYVAAHSRRRLRRSAAGGDQEHMQRAIAAIEAVEDADRNVQSSVNLLFALEDLAAGIAGGAAYQP